jgi:DNA-binding NarL/FixJ family response regulator
VRAEPALGAGQRISAVLVAEGGVAARRLGAELDRAGVSVAARVDPGDGASVLAGGRAELAVLACKRLDAEALAAIRALRERLPDAALLVVAGAGSNREIREALSEGADGFVLADRVDATLEQSIRAVCAGQLVVPGEWRERVGRPVLSPREKQVLGMVVMGFTNQEIANKLLVAESTVKSHLTSIFSKLGVRGRNEAAALVLDPASGLGTGVLAILDGAR